MPGRAKSKQDERDSAPAERAALPVDSRSRATVRAAIAIALVCLAAWMAADMLAPLAWAVVIAITTWPLYERVASAIPRGRLTFLAPLLFTIATGIVLLVPLMLALQQIAQASEQFTRWIGELQKSGVAVPPWVIQLPLAGELLDSWWQRNLTDPVAAREWLQGVNLENLAAWTRALGGEILHRAFAFVFALIALFFMFRDGGWLAERCLATADRLLGNPGEWLASKMADAVRGTVNGTIVVAVVEGTIIGAAYVLIGVPDAVLLALLTIAFAMLPLGAEIAVTLVSLLLLVQGFPPLWVLALFAFGMAVTIVGDNFVWPALVGRSARLPFLLALIGVLGGVQTFGLIGLFIGPVVMAALLTIWREWIAPKDEGN